MVYYKGGGFIWVRIGGCLGWYMVDVVDGGVFLGLKLSLCGKGYV